MSILSLAWELVRNYAIFGWPFLMLHVLVAGLVAWTWRSLSRESKYLEDWKPFNAELVENEVTGQSGAKLEESQATQILQQFSAEAKDLGGKGFFVPMTDFTDRLDSITSGKITELYERINLFLIVGIAGTLFGVFEFASRAAKVLHVEGPQSGESVTRVVQLGEILSSSLAKAFPVGFIGLVLMFWLQVFAAFPENRLKKAVASATKKALEQRKKVSQSQAQIVADAAERIETALKPLENLQETMAEHLGPVVEKLGERLEQSLGLVREQFAELQSTTSNFSSSVTELRLSVTTLGGNTEHLGRLLDQAPVVLGRLDELQAKQQEVIEAFQTNLSTSLDASQKTIRTLESATQAAQELPVSILKATQDALHTVSRDISATSAAMVAELKQRITADYNLLFQKVEEQIQALQQSLTATSQELSKHLADSSDALFAGMRGQTEALQDLIQTFQTTLGASLNASQRTISSLEIATRAAEELPARILETTQSALQLVSRDASAIAAAMVDELRQRMAVDYALLFQKVEEQTQALRQNLVATSEELAKHLSASSDALFVGVRGQAKTFQDLLKATSGNLERIGATAREAVAGLQELRSEAKASLEASFADIRQESSQRWGTMADEFVGRAQSEFANFVHSIQESTKDIRESLDESARSWGNIATNAADTIDKLPDPIKEMVENVGEELRKRIHDLDSLMAQRYPEVVRDVGAFTSGLQELLRQVGTVQQALDAWLQSLEKSRHSMEDTRRELLRQTGSPSQPAEWSPEVVTLLTTIRDRLDGNRIEQQLSPVHSRLSEMDRKIDTLVEPKRLWLPTRRRRSLSAPQTRSPHAKNDQEEKGEGEQRGDRPADNTYQQPPDLVEKESSQPAEKSRWPLSWFRRARH